MAISQGIAYYLKSICNPCEHNTAGWLTEHITPLMDDLVEAGVKVNAIVTDNGPVEAKVRRELSLKYNIISIPCAAHTLQLIVHFIMKQPDVKNVIDFFVSIVDSYIGCKAKRIELKDHADVGLMQRCTTRWNSALFMLERIQRIKAAMNKTAEKYPVVNIDEDRWQQLDDVITILKPFQVFTDQLQSDDAMLSVVYKGFENICEHVKNVSKQLPTAELKVMDWKSENVKTSVLMNIRKRYQGNIATAAAKLVHVTRFPFSRS